MQTKRAVIYIRVSTGKQVDGASLDTQEAACQQWCARNGLLIDKIFREEGASAKTIEGRPVMLEMLGYLKDNRDRLQYLVTYQTDRVSRSVNDFTTLRVMLQKMGIEYKNTNSSLETTAADSFILNVTAAAAEYDNAVKSERVSDNMRRHAKEGYRMSKAPHGLRNVRDVLGKSTLEPIPEVADKIAQLLNAYATGTHTVSSLLQLAREIGLQAYRGKELRIQPLSKMLRNPIYAGLEQNVHTEGTLVQSRFEGIITPATFYKNQELLTKNKNSAAKYKKNNPEFPLRRFLTCANCHKPITGSSPKSGSGKPSPRYHCARCHVPSINPEELHEQFYHLLASLTPDPEIERFLREMIIRVWREETRLLSSKEKRLYRALEQLTERQNKLIEQFIAGTITHEEKQAYASRLKDEEASIKKQLAQLGSMSDFKRESIDYALRFMANAPRIWNDANVEHRIIYQQLVFPHGLSYDLATNKFGTVETSVLYRLVSIKKDPSKADESLMVSHVDITWNSFLPYLVKLTDKLEDLGFRYVDNKVIVLKEEPDDK